MARPRDTQDTGRPYLLPGLICNDLVWRAQAHALADFGAVAVAGYGDARSIAAMAERILVSAPERLALAGHSMGARVALEILRHAPERVERLALLDTGVHGPVPGERARRMALVEIGRTRGMEALVEAWLPPMVHPDRRTDAAFLDPLRRMAIGAGLAQFENQVGALLGRPEVRSLLPTIRCPVLVGVGRQDEWSPVGQHEEIVEAIDGASLVVFENSGHMAPYEAPDQVTEALVEWMKS